jgi:hypothetical protein
LQHSQKSVDLKWRSEEVSLWTINKALGGRQPICQVKNKLPGGQPDQE